MKLLLVILSIVWIASGTNIILYTNQARSFLRELSMDMNIGCGLLYRSLWDCFF
ncbi:MAG: hypothetical protein RBS57_02525 [Desulforhabdus sp.]|nr:hypothetical protein [Desulforhabdus sp.]